MPPRTVCVLAVLLLGVILSLAAPIPVAAQLLVNQLADVDGAKPFLPVPRGIRAESIAKFHRDNPAVRVPEGNRVVAVFVEDGPDTCCYVSVQLYETPARRFTSREFNDEIKARVRSSSLPTDPRALDRVNAHLRRNDKALQSQLNLPGAQVRAKGAHAHKLMLETSELIIRSVYLEAEVMHNGPGEPLFRPAAMGFLRFNSRLVYLGYFGEFGQSADDPAFVRRAMDWSRALLTQNGLPTQ